MIDASVGENKRPTPSIPRRPAVWATLFFAAGILLDSYLNLAPSLLMWTILFGFLTLGLFSLIRIRTSAYTILIGLLLVLFGGFRHHEYRSTRSTNNIRQFADGEANTVRLVGIVCSDIEIIESEHGPRIPSWMEIDKSRFQLCVERIADGQSWKMVSGKVRVNLDGHLIHTQIGQRIELLGRLSLPAPVKNPGGFDFQNYLSHQGIDALCRVNHPLAISVLEDPNPWRWQIARMRESIRNEARILFTQHLSKPAKVIALSLLLGDRSQLNEDLRERFSESGAMHLLAISGLHIAILAGLIAVVCRLFNMSSSGTRLTVVGGVILFALLTNHRPPVLRATMLISILALGTTVRKRIDGMNVLAFCAGVLLLWKPTNLFDIGAQLSFLAVGAIIWSGSFLRKFLVSEEEEQLVAEGRRWLLVLNPLFKIIVQGYFITAAIWFATLPLTITVFNLVAPIGYVLNVVLIPYSALTLSFGYLFLIGGLLLPFTSQYLAIPFNELVLGLLNVVEWAHQLSFGHFHCAGFPMWWLIGFYFLLMLLWRLVPFFWTRFNLWKVMAVWIVIGLLTGWHSPERTGLRYTVLSVGHGLATVIELPSGETILYDAGTFGDGRRAERTIENYLRHQKIDHIDALVISHSDHDHFSGTFGLLKKFSVGTIFVSQQFLDFAQTSVKELCESALARKIPIRIVQSGDQLLSSLSETDQDIELEVLHPSVDFYSRYDNANSVVLELGYADRRLLLTGDLEKDGIEKLIISENQNFDLVMAPHHGSRYSSPQEFFDWADPAYILISSGDANVTQRLQDQVGPERQVLGTQSSGAISVEIVPDGTLSVNPFLEDDEN